MGLPFDKLNPVDKQIIETLKSQTNHLDSQTKVLHKLSDQIMNQRKSAFSFSLFDRSSKDMQKEMFKLGSGINEIKNYLRGGVGKTTADFGRKGAQPDKGFFTNLFSRVFGPSKYQVKMMEEITLLRELTERQSRNIEFLAEQNTDSKRAKERDLLAQAIARKINDLGLGGDSGVGGIVSTLGKALLAGVIGAMALLSKSITKLFEGFTDSIKKLLESLSKAFDFFKRVPPVLPGGGGGPAGPIPAPSGNDKPSKGFMGVPPVPPTSEQKAMPRDNRPLLPKPEEGKGKFKFQSKSEQQPVSDAKVRGGGPRFVPGARGALTAALATLGFLSLAEYFKNPENTGSIMGSNSTEELLDKIDRDLEAQRKKNRDKQRDLTPGEAAKLAGMKDEKLLDPETGQMVNARQIYEKYKDELPSDAKEKLDKYFMKKKSMFTKEDEALKQTEEKIDLEKEFNEILKKSIDSLEDLTETISDATKTAFKEKIVPFLNQIGEISIQGQKINLAPNLGDALEQALSDTYKLSEELAEYGKERITQGITSNTVNNVIDNSSNGSGATFIPAKPNNKGNSMTVDEFFFGRKIKN